MTLRRPRLMGGTVAAFDTATPKGELRGQTTIKTK
jgi:hypothetical protein